MSPSLFFSCDWGTTRFRLRLVRGPAWEVIASHVEDSGVRSIRLSLGTEPAAGAREEAFAGFLRERATELARARGLAASEIPVIVSGMASSNVGWRELPYALAPFPLDGRTANVERVELWRGVSPAPCAGCWLVSGVRTGTDMMRGEETELIGLLASGADACLARDAFVLLPGTHSKLVEVRAGALRSIRTFLTGELFEVLARHSLLHASVVWPLPVSLDDSAARAAFQAGLDTVREEGLSESLFRVRTRTVLGGEANAGNGWFLSGLLIGAELDGLSRSDDSLPILLGGAPSVQTAYAFAFERRGWNHRLRRVPPEIAEHAIIHAHAALLRRVIAGREEQGAG